MSSKRPGWDPTRRNRNLGTPKAGHGLANRMVIPESWNDFRAYWAKLTNAVELTLGGYTLLVEPCPPGLVHAVSIDDVVRMVAHVPRTDVSRIKAVVLRAPSKKQLLLASVWGRLAYFADFGSVQGPAVILEAHPKGYCFELPLSLSPDEAEELERLRGDGHEITRTKRSWKIHTTVESVRSTQLFRTLPHEVGHYVQYDREVRQAALRGERSAADLEDHYFTKPLREKEDFAHRYARELVEQLSRDGRVPFARLGDAARAKRFGLDPAWFAFDV